jgi:hypothetical protein
MSKSDTPKPQTVTEQTLQRLGIQWGTSEWIRVCNKLESDLAEAIESREFQRNLNIGLNKRETQTYTELTAARAEITEWRILKGWGGTPEIINDFIKGQQTRIHYAQNLEEELAAVTEQRDEALSDLEFRRDLFKLQEQQLNYVRAERDELLRYNEEFRKETLICADCDAIRKEEYDQAIEQRDRLQKIVDEQCRVSSVCREYREQRDRLAGEIIGWRNKWECAVDMAARAEVNRDRLAEAMRTNQI